MDQDKLHKEPTKSQDATCGYFLSRLSPVGRPRKGNENWDDVPIYNQETAAKRVGVDRKSIGHVKKVLESDSPIVEALGKGLIGGTTTINDALNIIVEPAEVQTTAMKMVQSGQAKTLARAARKINSEIGVGDSVLDPASGRPAQQVDNITIAHSGVPGLHALVNENSLDVIITTPSTDSSLLVNSLQELHDFAVHALASTGVPRRDCRPNNSWCGVRTPESTRHLVCRRVGNFQLPLTGEEEPTPQYDLSPQTSPDIWQGRLPDEGRG